MDSKELGLKIKELRVNANMTMEELAIKIGYQGGRQAINKIEKGTADVSLKTLKKICEACGSKFTIQFRKK